MQHLDTCMRAQGVDLYAVLSYTDVRETLPRLRASLPFAPQTVILFALPYNAGDTVNLSRYAAARDYHIEMQVIGEAIARDLATEYPEAQFAAFADHSPIDERHAALIGGLGLLGDNGLVITEPYGSYVFIGEVLTDVAPTILGATSPQPIRYCEGCGKCRAACPTGVLRHEAADCLSAITQRKGELTEQEIALMRAANTVWGCDICQSVCPHNVGVAQTSRPFFHQDRIEELSIERLQAMDEDTFRERAFAWRGRKTIERNLAYIKKR